MYCWNPGSSGHLGQTALYRTPSWPHFSLQHTPAEVSGHLVLLQSSGKKGLLTVIPERKAGSGFSTTLQLVLLGPEVDDNSISSATSVCLFELPLCSN